jgi:DNA helicase-2/ATP-dependent DNA helicase PcrA
VPFATVVDGVVIRGRIDAVFESADGSYDVVHWKTGARPSGLAAAASDVQVAAYRLAWAALADIPVERVRAAFVYIREGLTVRPSDLLDEAGLAALITAVPIAGTDADGTDLDGSDEAGTDDPDASD